MYKLYIIVIIICLLSLTVFTGCNLVKTQSKNYNFPLLAYQLEHQVRSTFHSAYDSYINLYRLNNTVNTSDSTYLNQIFSTLQIELKKIASEEETKKYIKRLKNVTKGGEGELNFPTHEVVINSKILKKENNQASISLQVRRYFPAREWSGKAYNRDFKYTIDLVKSNSNWKVKEVKYK